MDRFSVYNEVETLLDVAVTELNTNDFELLLDRLEDMISDYRD